MVNEKINKLKAHEFNLFMLAELFVKDGEVLKTRYGAKSEATEDVIELAKENLGNVVDVQGDNITIYVGETLGEYVESELNKEYSPLYEAYQEGNVKVIK